MGRKNSHLACITVNNYSLWALNIFQIDTTHSWILRRDPYRLASLPWSSLDVADTDSPHWLAAWWWTSTPTISLLGLSRPSWVTLLSNWIFLSCTWSTSGILTLSSSSGLYVLNWYLSLRWKYTSTNLSNFKFSRHKLDHCMSHLNSSSVLWNPFFLALSWEVDTLPSFYLEMGSLCPKIL